MTDLKSFREEGRMAVGELAKASGKLISLLAVADAAMELVETLEKVVSVAKTAADNIHLASQAAILEGRMGAAEIHLLEDALEPLKGVLAGLEVDHSDE